MKSGNNFFFIDTVPLLVSSFGRILENEEKWNQFAAEHC